MQEMIELAKSQPQNGRSMFILKMPVTAGTSTPGPSCSKLTMYLVNVSLKL